MTKIAGLIAAALCAAAPAQLQLQLRQSFAGQPGDSGVCQDHLGNFYITDGSGTPGVRVHDPAGSFLVRLSTAACTPSAKSPVGIAYDPIADSLWVADALSSASLSAAAVQLDRAGTCLGGFSYLPPSTRIGGIAYVHRTDTLWIAASGRVGEFDKGGAQLAGGFAFITPFGSRRLSGISYVPQLDRLLIVVEKEPLVYELDRAGNVLAIGDLSPFGVADPRGIHFEPATSSLAVVDAGQPAVYVFDLCGGRAIPYGTGCPDPAGFRLRLGATGCPTTGGTFRVVLTVSPGNTAPVWFAAGLGRTSLPNGAPLPLDLGPFGAAPGCRLYTSHEFTGGPFPNAGSGGSLAVTIPLDPALLGLAVYWQGLQIGPPIPTPLPVITSNGLQIVIG